MGSVTHMADDFRGEPRDPDLMTLSQAATFLRVRPTELMGAARSGDVPCHQGQDRLWFSRAELFQLMQNPSPSGPVLPGEGEQP